MLVVRRADHHGIYVLLLREHPAPVAVGLRAGVLLRRAGQPVAVHVAQRYHLDFLKGADFAEIPAALTAHADVRGGELFGRRHLAAAGDDMARHDERRDAGGDDIAEETTAGGDGFHGAPMLRLILQRVERRIDGERCAVPLMQKLFSPCPKTFRCGTFRYGQP